MKLLVTSGATREPIDAVRFLSNISTGATGAQLADSLAERGHDVTLLHGTGALLPSNTRDLIAFTSTADLERHLITLLGTGRYEAVVHCAAVSDYRPTSVNDAKISSDLPELTLRLVPTPKLLPRLKSFSPHPLTTIGFKLTSGANQTQRVTAVAKLFMAGTVDAVIHNDLDHLGACATRLFRAYQAGNPLPSDLPGLSDLAAWLHTFLDPR